MTTGNKIKIVKGYNVDKELAKLDKVLRSINNDKSLPSFCNFFLECLIFGNAEKVNLKKMYPKVYKKLNTLLEEHNAKILSLRK